MDLNVSAVQTVSIYLFKYAVQLVLMHFSVMYHLSLNCLQIKTKLRQLLYLFIK